MPRRPPPSGRRSIPLRNAHPRLRLPAGEVRRLFRVLDRSARFPAPPGELSIAILEADAMARLHGDFLGDPAVTDVITFDGDPEAGTAGEVCVCADAARDYAGEHGLAFARELALYLVHGYLHLAGFDDRDAAGRRRMRAAEREAMRLLDEAGAIPAAAWRAKQAPRT